MGDGSRNRSSVMDETRAIAHLPNLDIEVLHRQLPDATLGVQRRGGQA
jgi:hypothetical protein